MDFAVDSVDVAESLDGAYFCQTEVRVAKALPCNVLAFRARSTRSVRFDDDDSAADGMFGIGSAIDDGYGEAIQERPAISKSGICC